MKAKVFSIQGEEIKDIELSDNIFQRDVSDGAVYYSVNNELANRRFGTASVKTRGKVNYSNAKPWRQKGTGHARSGDKKSPVWVGGGTIFGPEPRDYSYKVPKKVKRLAIKSLLSQKMQENKLKIVEDFTVDSGRTKDLVTILKNLVNEERTVIVLGNDDAMMRRAGRNIPWVRFLSFDKLSARELLYSRNVLVLEQAAGNLNDFYADK
jgi:large subunit ribosomal protein L4